MNTYLHCAIALHVMHLQCPWNEFPGHFATDIFLNTVSQILSTERHATLIVIELHVINEEAAEFFQIAAVIRIEKRRIQRCDGLFQFHLRFNVFQRRNSLGLRPSGQQCQQGQ